MTRTLTFFALLISLSTSHAAELRMLNWEAYIPDSVLEKFHAKTSHTISVETYDSLDEAIAIISGNRRYDILVLSSHIIAKHKDKLLALDHKQLPNLKYLSTDFADPPYDSNNQVSIPYQWGTTGFGYNTDAFPARLNSWADLFNPQSNKIRAAFLRDNREVFGAALIYLGYSVNSKVPAQINKAIELVKNAKNNGVHFIGAIEGQTALAETTIDIAHGYSGDILLAQEENESIEYVIPQEGCTYWVDALAVGLSTDLPDEAQAFLNFTLEPEISAEITNANWYASPSAAADAHIDKEILSNRAIYPTTEDWKKMEFIRTLPPESEALYESAWEDITN